MAAELLQNYDAKVLLSAALKLMASDCPELETAEVESIRPGTAHVELPMGRFQGVHPRRLVEFLTTHTSISSRQVGDIDIQGNSTLVEIPMDYVDQVYAALGQYESKIRASKRQRISSGRRSAGRQASHL